MTKDQILNTREFHVDECTRVIGPRGGVRETIHVWRRNGVTKLWKRTPGRFRIPVKFGLYDHGYIDAGNISRFHAAEDCPLLEEEV